MAATAIKRPLDRPPEHGGGPPNRPRYVVQRDIVERREDGSLWRKPYQRRRAGNPLIEMLDGEWEMTEEQEQLP